MKKLLLALTLSLAVFLPRAQAVVIFVPNPLPFLSSIRSEVLDQLTLASNAFTAAVAVTNKVEAAKQKKLITLLVTTRKTIDRTKTNYVAGSTTLGVLNKNLGRSALSNEFNPILTNTFNVYLASLINLEDLYSDRVDASYPGKAQDAAAKTLDKFLAALNSASTNTNFLARIKFLAAASKGEALALKATVKAENAPVVLAEVKAVVSGAVRWKYNSFIGAALNVTAGNTFLNTAQGIFHPIIGLRGVTLTLTGINAGANTLTVGNGSGGTCSALVYDSTVGKTYESVSGTVHATHNTAGHTLYGDFDINLEDDSVTGRFINIKGTFFTTTL